MSGADDWTAVIPVDTSDDVHVADTIAGVHVFYTEDAEAYIRSDTVVDVNNHR